MRKLIAFAIILLTAFTANAQTGTIAGRIIDEETSAIVSGVTVTVEKAKISKTSDVEGRFIIRLAPGTYTLSFHSVGFTSKQVADVVVKAGETTEINISIAQQAKKLADVVVTSSAKKESAASLISMQRNNSSISDGISAETIKKSPDRNVGQVLKRVSGTSIQDDRFVIVRGLSDRYNVALINGALLPSTEPDRRAFSFDLVPATLIDNILINKTASPDMPGDFSGGLIQIMTKDIPFNNFLSASIGAGINTQSTGRDFRIGLLTPTDYLGFDNGRRMFPERFPGTNRYRSFNADPNPDRRLAASRLMRNNYGDRFDGSALPLMNLQLNWGGRKDFKNGGAFGSVVSLTYRNAQTIQFNSRRDYESLENHVPPVFDYNDTVYSFTTNVGMLANFAYRKGNTKIAFKNLANRMFDNNNLFRAGENRNNLQYIQTNGSMAVMKTMISSQLEGEHLLNNNRKDRLRWNLNYTLTAQEQPDYRILPYQKSLNDMNDKTVPFRVVLRDTYRFWSDLMDNAFGANINYSLPFRMMGHAQQFKAGALTQYKVRDFRTRIFRYEETSANFNQALLSLPPRQVFNDGNINEEGFVLNEITNNTDRYTANSGLYAAYAMIDGKISERLRAVYGVRVESFNFQVNTADFSGAKVRVDRNYIDILPSLNLTYKLDRRANLRFSASQTVARPEFREVANFVYFDFIRNAQIKGNPELERSQNTNLDLRYEFYPSSGEIFSASVFFKHFKNPIEQAIIPGTPVDALGVYFINPEAARIYGVEMEVRKKLGFLGSARWLENMVFTMNAAYMRSTVRFAPNTDIWDANRPLQGQSPWLINAGLQYALPNEKVSFSVMVNRIGERVAYVGSQQYPDIYENGRTLLDFQAAFKLLRNKAELRLNFADLLNQRAIFYQNATNPEKRAYNASEDRQQFNFLYGRNLGFTFAYNFK